MTDALPFTARFVLAFACFFRLLLDGALAARIRAVMLRKPELPAAAETKSTPKPKAAPKEPPSAVPALQLLALLQREGRFIDFLKQDVASFSDSDIGAAARVVHEGCRKALASHAEIECVRDEEEGSKVTLEAGFDASRVKLTGNVAGSAPYRGTLRHKGWSAKKLDLPTLAPGRDAHLLYPAEVEL